MARAVLSECPADEVEVSAIGRRDGRCGAQVQDGEDGGADSRRDTVAFAYRGTRQNVPDGGRAGS